MEREVIINDRVDGMLTKLEERFKEAEEKKKPLQKKLDEEVKALMDEYDGKEETKNFENTKAIVDYIAITLGMPLEDRTKEEIIEQLTKEGEENGSILEEKV